MIDWLVFKSDGYCDICKEYKPAFLLKITIPVGYYNADTEVGICDDCLNKAKKRRDKYDNI